MGYTKSIMLEQLLILYNKSHSSSVYFSKYIYDKMRVTEFEQYTIYVVIVKLITIYFLVKIKLILPVLVFVAATTKLELTN